MAGIDTFLEMFGRPGPDTAPDGRALKPSYLQYLEESGLVEPALTPEQQGRRKLSAALRALTVSISFRSPSNIPFQPLPLFPLSIGRSLCRQLVEGGQDIANEIPGQYAIEVLLSRMGQFSLRLRDPRHAARSKGKVAGMGS